MLNDTAVLCHTLESYVKGKSLCCAQVLYYTMLYFQYVSLTQLSVGEILAILMDPEFHLVFKDVPWFPHEAIYSAVLHYFINLGQNEIINKVKQIKRIKMGV